MMMRRRGVKLVRDTFVGGPGSCYRADLLLDTTAQTQLGEIKYCVADDRLSVYNVFTEEPFRRYGVATMLRASAMRHALALGAKKIAPSTLTEMGEVCFADDNAQSDDLQSRLAYLEKKLMGHITGHTLMHPVALPHLLLDVPDSTRGLVVQ